MPTLRDLSNGGVQPHAETHAADGPDPITLGAVSGGVSATVASAAGFTSLRFVPTAASPADLVRAIPPTSSWTALGTITPDYLADDSIRLYHDRNGDENTPDIYGLYRTLPGTNWTVTAKILAAFPWEAYLGFGMFFYENGSGKIASLDCGANGSIGVVGVNNFNSRTSWNATLKSYRWWGGMDFYMKIADDGTNRISSISADGEKFITVYSVSRTSFLTADRVGFYINSQTNANPAGIVATLVYWKPEVLP